MEAELDNAIWNVATMQEVVLPEDDTTDGTTDDATTGTTTGRRLTQVGAEEIVGDTPKPTPSPIGVFIPIPAADPSFNSSYVVDGVRNTVCGPYKGATCSSTEFFSLEPVFKTLSLGILQHPGFAMVGYALPMGIMLVGTTILALALGSSMIILFALMLHFGFSAMLGYHEFGGNIHDTAAVATALAGTMLHIFILYKQWTLLQYLKWVYMVFIGLIFIGFLFLIIFQVSSIGTPMAYSIVEHGIVTITVLSFAFPVYALQAMSGKMVVYVEG
eukprot:1637009-Rhodomonas_salina.1